MLRSRLASILPKSLNVQQADSRPSTWSRDQQERRVAYNDVRFVGIELDLQPNPPAAIELLQSDPVVEIKTRIVSCDGGGSLGHPKIYINLDKPQIHSCMYCSKKFIHRAH
jgi:NADH dehydrogenase (ubiquinone) Fe-S protein 6